MNKLAFLTKDIDLAIMPTYINGDLSYPCVTLKKGHSVVVEKEKYRKNIYVCSIDGYYFNGSSVIVILKEDEITNSEINPTAL